MKKYCEDEQTDVSSLVAFSVYRILKNYIKTDKKRGKLIATSDRRFFMQESEKYSVGAFDGVVELSFDKKSDGLAVKEAYKKFHLSYYKAMTSPFRSFYNDYLLMKLIPESCNASYLYALGYNKNKSAKNLAENYGCLNKKICRYSAFALQQDFWSALNSFSRLRVYEAFRMRYDTSVSFTEFKGKGIVLMKYKTDILSQKDAEKVVNDIENLIMETV